MAEIGGMRSSLSAHNIYTVLLGIAFVALLIGVGYVWFRYAALFEKPNPFSMSAAEVMHFAGLA